MIEATLKQPQKPEHAGSSKPDRILPQRLWCGAAAFSPKASTRWQAAAPQQPNSSPPRLPGGATGHSSPAYVRSLHLKESDWYFIAEQPAPAPHLAHPEGCAAPITVSRVSRSCENLPDGFDLCPPPGGRDRIWGARLLAALRTPPRQQLSIQLSMLHPTPYTLHPDPYTLHPTPYTLHPTP